MKTLWTCEACGEQFEDADRPVVRCTECGAYYDVEEDADYEPGSGWRDTSFLKPISHYPW